MKIRTLFVVGVVVFGATLRAISASVVVTNRGSDRLNSDFIKVVACR